MRNQALGFDTFRELYATNYFFTSLLEDTIVGFYSDYHLHDGLLYKDNQLCVPEQV